MHRFSLSNFVNSNFPSLSPSPSPESGQGIFSVWVLLLDVRIFSFLTLQWECIYHMCGAHPYQEWPETMFLALSVILLQTTSFLFTQYLPESGIQIGFYNSWKQGGQASCRSQNLSMMQNPKAISGQSFFAKSQSKLISAAVLLFLNQKNKIQNVNIFGLFYLIFR